VCVLDPVGLEESQKSGFRKNYELYLRKSGNVAIGICKADCRVNVISTVTEWD
jgi:hypothetical protein